MVYYYIIILLDNNNIFVESYYMWIEDEIKKDASEIQTSINELSRDYTSKLMRTIRTHMRENKENTTKFFTNFYESVRKAEYELYKQFSVLNGNTDAGVAVAKDNTTEQNISKYLTHDFTEIRNSANDLPHPRILSELQRDYERRVGRHSAVTTTDTDNENHRYIPYHVYSYIREKSEYCIRFQANIRGRNITLYFITFPESHVSICGKMNSRISSSSSSLASSYLCASEIAIYQLYAYKVFIWLSIVSQMSSKECSEKLDVYFYMTPFKKERPSHHDSDNILSAIHVNTGLTRNCEKHGEIIVYRTEEWFKVFVHESMHNFNIDFIDLDLREANNKLRKAFCIPHEDILLFESYTETWARIINVMFETYFHNDRRGFIHAVREKFMNNAFFHVYQIVKVLDIMKLKYSQITVLTPENMSVCRKQYKENTNVYAYYIFGGILSAYALPFISWCSENNKGSVIRFTQSSKNLNEFTELICNASRDPVLLNIIDYIETRPSSSARVRPILSKTMRMTLE